MDHADNEMRAAAAEECRQSRWRSSVCLPTRQSKVFQAANHLRHQPILTFRREAIPSMPRCGGWRRIGRSAQRWARRPSCSRCGRQRRKWRLGDLLKQFQQSGHGETVDSWVGTGPNKTISPNDLAGALGSDRVNAWRRKPACPEMVASRPQRIFTESGRPVDAARTIAY